MARLAFVGPMPPAPTGVASYAAAVLDALGRTHLAVEHELESVWPLADNDPRVLEATLAIYHVGNNVEFHGRVYAHALRRPGIVVLHDVALDDLMAGLTATGSDLGESARREIVARRGVGTAARADDPLGFPWCLPLVRRAHAVIVHSTFAAEHVRSHGVDTPVHVVPHPTVEAPARIAAARAEREAFRGRALRRRRDALLVAVAGDLNPTKGIEAVMRAIGMTRHPIHLVLVGRTVPAWDVAAAVRASGHARHVTIVPHVSDSEFLAWLGASDVLVNLRFPHRGESSGTLLRALQMGVPTVVSAGGAYLEWPEDVVVRVSPGPPNPAEIAAVLDGLAADPAGRVALGRRAARFVAEACRPELTAEAYERAIEETLAWAVDPARLAMRRSAGALAEIGMSLDSADMVRRLGYGAVLAELWMATGTPGATRPEARSPDVERFRR